MNIKDKNIQTEICDQEVGNIYNNKRSFYVVIVALVVVFFVVAILYIISINQNSVIPQSTTKQSTSSTSNQNQTTNSANVNNPIDKYQDWKDCENIGLAISLKIPQSWTCINRDVGTNWGFMILEGDSLTVEIENEGRGFGCMGYSGCSDSQIFDSNMISISLETTNNIDQYMFGVFKDNTDERPYGGVYITYDEIHERKMTESEENTLFMILDSMKRL